MTDRAVLREMTPEDFAAVYRLGQRCYKVRDAPYNYWSIGEVAHHLEMFPELCLVADVDGDVVAFALGDSRFELIEDAGHLEWVAVDAAHRRQGLATRLIEEMIERFRRLGKRRVVADIASDNPYSRAMAQKTGFREGISVTFFEREL